MSWTTPRTWTTGEVVTAAMMNAHVRDNMTILATGFNTANGKIPAISLTYFASLATISLTQNTANPNSPVVNSGSGETVLFSYVMPGNTLTGGAIRLTCWGTTTNSANTKTIRQYFGSGNTITVQVAGGTAVNWFSQSLIARIDNSTQTSIGIFDAAPTSSADVKDSSQIGGPNQILSGSVTIETTGQATVTGEITGNMQIIELLYS